MNKSFNETDLNKEAITQQDIIEAKIAMLNGHTNSELSQSMQSIIESDDSLKEELVFIEKLWKSEENDNLHQPSPDMRARFYQMLSHAQTHAVSVKKPGEQLVSSHADSSINMHETKNLNNENVVAISPQSNHGLFDWFKNISWLKPGFQFAFMVSVFSFGWFLSQSSVQVEPRNNVALEKKIDALNVMVALSMLQDDSASERLAGLQYATQNGLSNQKVTTALVKLIDKDRSSAVRLNAVQILAKQNKISLVRTQLVESLSRQTNPIVQMALAEVLLSRGTLEANELEKILKNTVLDSSVVALLKSQEINSDINRI